SHGQALEAGFTARRTAGPVQCFRQRHAGSARDETADRLADLRQPRTGSGGSRRVRGWGSGFSLGSFSVGVVDGNSHTVATALWTRQVRRLKPELQQPATARGACLLL